MFVLLGSSGAGKTSLLRAIGGFARPEAGQIVLSGRDITALPPHRRPVNTMFQSYALFPHMTVAGNIGFGLRSGGGRTDALDTDNRSREGGSREGGNSPVGDWRGGGSRDQGGVNWRDRWRATIAAVRRSHRPDAAARVAEMLALVRLDGYGERRPHELSGGQQQRVALARSLAPNPALLLLDEPLSALDRGLRGETRAELIRLRRRLGTSFILVTHDQEEALMMADRLGVMRDGRMAQVGTPAEVYERPNSRYVAEFLGAANILPGTLSADGRWMALAGLDCVVRLDARRGSADAVAPPAADGATADGATAREAAAGGAMAGGAMAGGAIAGEGGAGGSRPGAALLGLRPERLRLGDGVNALPGVLVDSTYAGDRVQWVVRLRNGALLRVAQPLAEGVSGAGVGIGGRPGTAGAAPAIGGTVVVSWPPEACMLLPA